MQERKNNTITKKDLITIGVYTVLYIVMISVAGMLSYMPIFVPLTAVLIPLLGAFPYLLFLTKVNKFGMVLIMGTAIGLLMLIGGMGSFTLPLALITSALAELIIKSGRYKSAGKAVPACAVFHLWAIGNLLPFYVNNHYYAVLEERLGTAYTDTLRALLPLWTLPVLIAVCFVSGLIGGFIAKTVSRKKLERAGIL